MTGSNTRCGAAVLVCVGALAAIASPAAYAGQDANFMLYNHYMEEKGATEVKVFSDYSHVGNGDPNYTAQLIEIEYGVTELFSTALYFEGVKTFADGEDYKFGSFRFENRLRLFKDETLLNPVLYAEYEYKKPESRFLRAVVGRTDGEEEDEGGGEEASEHELETKVILGHDFGSNLNVAFNTIHEVNFANGVWKFGYVAGLNYTFFRAYDSPDVSLADSGLQKLTLGLEFFSGAGDSENGLTLDSGKTEQYVGVGLRADFKNNFSMGIGGGFGLNDRSEEALMRVNASYEFE